MPLEKASKEILLYGGMDNDKAEHLQSQPNVAYVENGHWRNKEGVIQKRLGLIDATKTGKPLASITPAILHPQNGKVHTFLDGKAYSYSPREDEWDSTDQVRLFARNESYAAGVRGSLTSGSDFYCSRHRVAGVAQDYKVFVYGYSKNASRGVVYDPNDSVIGTFEVQGGFPKLVPNSSDGVYLWTCSGGGDLRLATVDLPGGTVGSQSVIATDVYVGHGTDFGGGPTTSFYNNPAVDIEGEMPFYCVTSGTDRTEYHQNSTNQNFVAWCEAATGDMILRCIPTGVETRITSGFSDAYYPLAITHHEFDDDDIFVVYSSHIFTAPSTLSANTRIRRYAKTISGTDPAPIYSSELGPNSSQRTVRAAMAMEGNDIMVALTRSSGDTELYETSPSLPATPPQSYIQKDRDIKGHIVTTNMLFANPTGGTGRFYVGLQMFPIPDVSYAREDDDTADSFSCLRFPSTTYIVDITNPGSQAPQVVAAFDVNQSKVTDFSRLASDTHTDKLDFGTNDDFYITNREVFTFEGVHGGAGTDHVPNKVKYLGADSRINVYRAAFSQSVQAPGVSLGDGLIVPGGATLWWDGEVLSELNPLAAPVIVSATNNVQSGVDPFLADEVKSSYNNLAGGNYTDADWRRMAAVIGYTDANGNTHRSAPSPIMFALGVTPGANSVSSRSYTQGYDLRVTIHTPLSMNPDQMGGGKYFAELYISDTVSGPPKLADRVSFAPSTSSVTFHTTNTIYSGADDNDGDTFVAGNVAGIVRSTPPLYTEGGQLPSDPWPSIAYGVATSQRIFAISADDTGQVYYSKRFRELTSPEFSAPLVLSLGDERKLTAIGKLDDKVVVFESEAIHVIYGPGPDDTGTSGRAGGFDIHQVTSDVGCDQPGSLVETPLGLMFKSKRGFHILDRALKLHFVGAAVYDMAYNATVKSSCIVPEWGEVRFLMAGRAPGTFIPEFGFPGVRTRPAETRYTRETPSCLVFNYEFNRWAAFSDYSAEVGTTLDGEYIHIRSDWSIQTEARPEQDYYDSNMVIETPWEPVSDDMQGLARVRRVTVLGKYLTSNAVNLDGVDASNDLTVEVLYDYEEPDAVVSQPESHTWRGNVELLDYPNAVPLRVQFRFKPGRQKCQAIKFRFTDKPSSQYWITGLPDVSTPDATTYATGRGFELSSVNLDLGIKAGPVRSLPGKRKQ